jgi:hypothetical protein
VDLGTLTPLLAGLVDDAGLFPPAWLPMDQALARHRGSASPMLSGRFLCPSDRVGELLALLGADERLDVHLIGDDRVELPVDPRLTVRAVELRSGVRDDLPCYVEGVPPKELKGHGVYGKLRCGGARIPSVEEVAGYVTAAARVSLPFKGTAGMHAAVRGWESTRGEPHHGYLNLLLAVARSLSNGDVTDVLASTDAEALASEARELSDDLVTATRWMLHSYGSCDTARPVADARDLGLL